MLTLIRHAETEFNRAPTRFQGRRDTVLTAEGRHAAKELGWTLPEYDVIVSSPLSRCVETANALRWGREGFRVDERLVEIDVGRWEGLSHEQVALTDGEGYEQWRNTPDAATPGGGESIHEMRARVMSAMSELQREFRGRSVLIVTHGGPIRTVRICLGALPMGCFHELDVPNLYRLDIPEQCSLVP